MAIIHRERNIFFDPLQVVHDVIHANVLDPNPERRERPKESERKWIFPTTPEANDENYPRIAIIHGVANAQEWTAGQFLEYEKDASQQLVRAVNTNIVTIPVTVAVFTKKTKYKALEVVDYDGSKRFVENSAQVMWLLDKIQNTLMRNRRSFIDKDLDFTITDIEGTYEDNDFLWAGEISMTIVMKNVWTEDIPKIIGSYNQDLLIQLEDGSEVDGNIP